MALAVTDRAAWLSWRRGGIGASDAAAIAGLDPYRGPMSVFLDKSGLLPLEADEAEHVKWGTLLEPAIAAEFEQRTGLYVVARALMLEANAPDRAWMRATIDGLVDDRPFGQRDEGTTPAGVLEIKTVAGWKSEAWAEGVPEHFVLQVQHQLAVTGLDHAWVAVLFGGQRMEIRELERDDDLIASLIDLESAFWTRHVLTGTPPASDGYEKTTEDLRAAFAEGGGPAVDLPAEIEDLLLERAEAKAEAAAAEVRVAAVDQTLMALLGDAEVGLLGGRPRVSWRRQTRKSYTVAESTFRVLRFMEEEGS